MSEPADAVDIRAALHRLRRSTGLPVAFGGLLHDARQLRIAELSGAATGALRGLAISAGNGLGGKSIALSRPCAVSDYPSARQISHEYDAAVATEGLRSVLAVPVVVRRKVRGVLYGALREPVALGERTFDAAVAAARDVEQALVVRDEVQRLLAEAREPVAGTGAWEEVREVHGELRALAPRIGDQTLRDTLLAVCGRLAAAAGGPPRNHTLALAPRELDVLACVAAGSTNATAAERLGLKPETVKGYLRAAMRKLGAHTRLEAVVAARRAGLLP
ncbi:MULTISPECIES: LuxR C-terminal-related transcriptional regulator [unclassified Streptomyces]|uniref:helix-turn-helix transcriptional regulator n=1 Tax=unclassified Streptomyces TaxID=2593676 RepID=UPI002DDA06AE|nr:LuxR C-terminal-related transcriptional regulator [Streptomyces sp. NBC_01750]WSA99273.1 LuxR C-terminal-related transcriptional regulator [Streptomyces sp. NBC_01794]WSD36161.1 LuxR C-terminal-related transcriptional regulator [Streptomyces sp. NBC_01750]